MPRTLAVDVGSSSVKAAVVEGGAVVGPVSRRPFPTRRHAGRSEVSPEDVLDAFHAAINPLDAAGVEALALTAMGPAWLALSDAGRPLTPIVTHADRRSLDEARRIEAAVGRDRHLALAGNRPTPGGISSTTAAWFARHRPDAIRRAATLCHLPTWLIHQLTGRLTIDPSNAGFSGLMDVSTGAWSDELCAAANVPIDKLPLIADAADVHGGLTSDAAAALGLPAGLPVVGGFVDGSGPLLLAGARIGQLAHSAGSTDVLALCLGQPTPRDGLLCRPLGTGGKWVAAATLSSAGSLLDWLKGLLKIDDFDAACRRALARPDAGVTLDPHFAGDRQRVDQPTGGVAGLTLATTADDLLRAALVAVADNAADRYARLAALGTPILPEIVRTGGAAPALADLLAARLPHAARHEDQATLRGAAALTAPTA